MRVFLFRVSITVQMRVGGALCVLALAPNLADTFRTDVFCDSYPCPTGWLPTDGASETACNGDVCTIEQCCGERRCWKIIVRPIDKAKAT